MKIEIHKSSERGYANHGWLHTFHSFSFADYYNPQRMGFGALRVLNEDWIEAGKGFGKHPHDNMEIVTIVLEGVLEHKDSMGNHGTIKAEEVQRMSAGTGVFHSEVNHSNTKKVHLLQIWLETQEQDIPPSYEQKRFTASSLKNRLACLVSGGNINERKRNERKGKEGACAQSLSVHQDALFLRGKLDKGVTVEHIISSARHGIYVFVISGRIKIVAHILEQGDAMGICDAQSVSMTAEEDADVLVMEVPMDI